jgi:GDP/UDP-N,N'-diacetylbacillosamine 2-epimerase (hydrolysing)
VSRAICVVTGSRAEYGLLRWVMQGVRDAPDLTLQIIATGTHLSPEFGLTYREIEGDGFCIDQRVEMLLSSDTAVGVSKSMGVGMIGFADALSQLRPDILVVLGDRYEILCAAAAALVARIPVAHVHGGEASEGTMDESIRHAVTKLSHLHFTAAEPYRQRVIQMGEHPSRVFTVGALGIDSIQKLELLDREQLQLAIDFEFGHRNLLVTFHPPTLDSLPATRQVAELLAALDTLEETHFIFTMPNADPEARSIMAMLAEFATQHSHARVYRSLGQLRYLSCLRYVDGVVGNSSSGLNEATAMSIGTVNIGDRQRGRLRASTVIDCPTNRTAIRAALDTLYSAEFQRSLDRVQNPYGDGGASEKIAERLRREDLGDLLRKSFHQLPQVAELEQPS